MKFHLLNCRLTFLTLLTVAFTASADVTLPPVLGSGMVLQRDLPVPVWGWADAGEKVSVTFAGQTKTTKAGADGKWIVKLDPLKANSKTASLTVTGNNKISLDNVLVGEVWICSGQSNMEWALRSSMNAKEEVAAADHPQIRLFNVPGHTTSPLPKEKGAGSWQVCNPKSATGFSAVGYFFGRRLQKDLGVPVGLVGSNWGGTRIEPWTTLAGFESVPELSKIADQVKNYKADTKVGGGSPSAIYNSMVHPLAPFAMRGGIWYQGESNGGEGVTYYHKKHGLVKGWRKVWNQGDFPFYWVQLANFTSDKMTPQGGDGYAKIRDAERMALDIPNTGMAVITDIGETDNIHPKNKQDVGKRLALWALAKDYGKKLKTQYSGPLFSKVDHAEGKGSLTVHFHKETTGGLTTSDKKPASHFEISGKDGKWHPAKVTIVYGDHLIVSSTEVKNPVHVRFGWNELAEPNLVNRAGLPASPFNTAFK